MAQAPSPYAFLNDSRISADEEEARAFAQMTPLERAALERRRFQQGIGRGFEEMGARALGVQTPAQQRQRAGLELRELATKVRPGTAEFYQQASAILQKYGLVAEAETMAQRERELKQAETETKSGDHELLKLQRTVDTLQKRVDAGEESVLPALEAAKQAVAKYNERKQGSQPADPEFVKLLNAWKAEEDPERKGYLKRALEAHLSGKQKSGADMTPYQAAMVEMARRRDQRDQEKADNTRSDAVRAYGRAKVAVLNDAYRKLNAAERLRRHPGLSAILGSWVGAFNDTLVGMAGDAPAGAMQLWKNVSAQTFLAALEALKSKSTTNTSGLGQLTEREGDKIQSAEAALGRQQPPRQFMASLDEYIARMKGVVAGALDDLSHPDFAKAGVQAPPRPAVVDDSPAEASLEVQPREGRKPVAERPQPRAQREPSGDDWDAEIVRRPTRTRPITGPTR